MSRVSSTIAPLSQAEQEQLLPFGSNLRGDDTWDDGQQRRRPPLRVELTGYRLFTTSVILGFGIPKAVYVYYEQPLISPTLDWIGGMIFALLLFWLGEIGTNYPEFLRSRWRKTVRFTRGAGSESGWQNNFLELS
ncbi:hypothetical protein BC827DRAFT_711920 [Russula dissimulans]|nr:hypothetical protein BC827DRAFT_711920 [Russula dissimulans]